MKKFIRIKTLSFLLVLSIVFSCSFGSYALARESKWYDGFWNDTKTIKENLVQHAILVGTAGGIAWNLATGELFTGVASGSASLGNIKAFDDFMADRGFNVEDEEEMKQLITYNSETKNITISDSFNDVAHEYINLFLQESSGYVTIPTVKFSDIDASYFGTKEGMERLKSLCETFEEPFYLSFTAGSEPAKQNGIACILYGGYNYIPLLLNGLNTSNYGCARINFSQWLSYYKSSSSLSAGFNAITPLFSDWTFAPNHVSLFYCFEHNKFTCDECTNYYSKSNYKFDKDIIDYGLSNISSAGYASILSPLPTKSYKTFLLSNDGAYVKVWKSIDSFKQYDIGQQSYYASQEWYNYDYSNTDNSTYSESFVDNSIKDSNNQTTYNEIVNNYSDGMTESEVAHLIETIMKNQKEINNTPPSSDGGGGSSTGGSGGTGLGALLDGIGGLLDFIVTLIGKVVSLITDTLTTILNSFSGFTDLFSGFSEFLASAFSFVPEEVWTILISGCSVMVVLAIIKFLKG